MDSIYITSLFIKNRHKNIRNGYKYVQVTMVFTKLKWHLTNLKQIYLDIIFYVLGAKVPGY